MHGERSKPKVVNFVSPPWLDHFFGCMAASFKHVWTNQFVTDEVMLGLQEFWFDNLKQFDEEAIRKGTKYACDNCAYPPTLCEMLEFCRMFKREAQRITDEKHLLEAKPLGIDRRGLLKIQVEGWKAMGNRTKMEEAQKLLDELEKGQI